MSEPGPPRGPRRRGRGTLGRGANQPTLRKFRINIERVFSVETKDSLPFHLVDGRKLTFDSRRTLVSKGNNFSKSFRESIIFVDFVRSGSCNTLSYFFAAITLIRLLANYDIPFTTWTPPGSRGFPVSSRLLVGRIFRFFFVLYTRAVRGCTTW